MGNLKKIRDFLAKNCMTQDELCKRLGLTRDILVESADKEIEKSLQTAFGKGELVVVESMETFAPWAQKFPVRSLQRQGFIPPGAKGAELTSAIFRFMGTASVEGFNNYYAATLNSVNPQTYAAWIRLGELRATRKSEEFSFNKELLTNNLLFLRKNTVLKSLEKGKFRDTVKEVLKNSGFEFIQVEPFITAPLPTCACYWAGNQPVIQVPTTPMNDSVFLEAVFHAVAHIWLHPKRTMCLIAPQTKIETQIEMRAGAQTKSQAKSQIEMRAGAQTEMPTAAGPAKFKRQLPSASNTGKCDEAARFAQNMLLTEAQECELICNGHFAERRCISYFAGLFHVRPGILVERLQQQGMISARSPLNDFKVAI